MQMSNFNKFAKKNRYHQVIEVPRAAPTVDSGGGGGGLGGLGHPHVTLGWGACCLTWQLESIQ